MMTVGSRPDITSEAIRAEIDSRLRYLENMLGTVELAEPDADGDGDISREMVQRRIRVLREMVAVLSQEGPEST